MYFAIIISIAWLYITVLMAASQNTLLAAFGTLVFYGLIPAGLIFYIATAKHRRRTRQQETIIQEEDSESHS